jgi:protein-L-isoaspartate(D-aspartate) O-methyltransferase
MFPRMEGRLLQILAIKPTDHVLEIGTGSGFLTACLAHLAKRVVSVDIHAELTEKAAETLKQANIRNVEFLTCDALDGPIEGQGPFDAIAVTGSLPTRKQADIFTQQLTTGGRLFVIVGEPPVMEVLLITKLGDNSSREEILFETEQAPLENSAQPARFEF